ncbi:hypothetical protein CAEBREN_10228 [Caenorhabditis brenneri]|uniref:Uncharacterized protein n=1 Tax=Caenorhabditis brenneri TaxID=135651 RepID=G0MUU9_CAEBE|nr:hypothetical protein CAEBREN_10228 [Caenorhabditis brenneri]
MILHVSNSTDALWIPVFSLNDKVYQNPFYLLFSTFLIIFYLFIAYIILKTCQIFLKIQVFHENMNILMAWFLLQWFEAILAKMVILPYQIGLISIGINPERSYCSWSSLDQEDILVVRQTEDILPLFVASCLLWHYMLSILFGVVVITVERGCATYFMEDYESKSRRHIPILLIILTNIITIPYSYFILHYKISILLSYSQCVANGTFVFIGYFLLLKVNLYWREKINGRDQKEKYSLARKFQIEENLRSLMLAKKLVFACVAYMGFTVLILFCQNMNIFPQINLFFVHYLDNCILIAALVMSVTLLCCSPSWKEKFINEIPLIRNFLNSRVSNSHFMHQVFSTKDSEAYFEQLKNAWA